MMTIEEIEIQDLIEENGGFYFLRKDNSQGLERQLVRLKKFQLDFSITKKAVGDCIVKFFTISDEELKLHAVGEDYDSSDSHMKDAMLERVLLQRAKRFEQLKRKIDGITFPL